MHSLHIYIYMKLWYKNNISLWLSPIVSISNWVLFSLDCCLCSKWCQTFGGRCTCFQTYPHFPWSAIKMIHTDSNQYEMCILVFTTSCIMFCQLTEQAKRRLLSDIFNMVISRCYFRLQAHAKPRHSFPDRDRLENRVKCQLLSASPL